MAIKSIDKYAILSAIWIIASNDENPIISYEGLRVPTPITKEFRCSVVSSGTWRTISPRCFSATA